MTLTNAYLLVSHGSRDPRPQIALERLSYLVQQQIQATLSGEDKTYSKQRTRNMKNPRSAVLSPVSPLILETASLELSEVQLRDKIQQVAKQGQKVGVDILKIVPLFLLPGVHVTEDIPREVEIAKQTLGNSIKLKLCPYLGSYKGLIKILSRQFSEHPQDARIIISHGSRRLGGNCPVEAIADRLNASVAYWSISPSLEDKVYALVNQGKTSITIVPYFLFTGGITMMIAQQVEQLQRSLPHIQFNLGHPLGATSDLAALMAEEIRR
ncbi:MAG: sirohydrochlorin chelatase [Cyanobacteria bacterium P01_G01_bin.49]